MFIRFAATPHYAATMSRTAAIERAQSLLSGHDVNPDTSHKFE
jgi:hypothetical protein